MLLSLREFSSADNDDRRWVVFDGPVDRSTRLRDMTDCTGQIDKTVSSLHY